MSKWDRFWWIALGFVIGLYLLIAFDWFGWYQ